jgi:hypothetical protein
VAATRAFEFFVSAPAAETFAWLHGRGEKSGEVVSADPARGRFAVRWDAGPEAPATLEFAVRAQREHVSFVTVAVAGEAGGPQALVEQFAGPLGARMTGLRARAAAFFDPPVTTRDNILIAAWAILFAVLLTVVVTTRHIPPEDEDMSGREAIVEILLPIVLAAFAAGLAGGLVIRRRGRWYEIIVMGLALGVVVSYFVFDAWFLDLDRPTATNPESSEKHMALGAMLCAVLEALILVCGVGVGRIPLALTWLVRSLRRRRPERA